MATKREVVLPWSVVLGGFLCLVCSVGFQFSFGEWLVHYETRMFKSEAPAVLSLVGSVQVAFTDVFCLIAGFASDRYGPRVVTVAGAILVVSSHLFLAFSVRLWQVYLVHGVLLGIGEGCLTLIGLTGPAVWQPHRRGIALATAGLGMAAGALIWPLIFNALLLRHGFRWANIGVALVATGLCLPACYLIRAPTPELQAIAKSGTVVGQSRFKRLRHPAYLLICFSKQFGWFGAAPFQFYLPSLALHYIKSPLRVYILPITMLVNMPARVISGLLADRIGILNAYLLASAFAAIICWTTWLPADGVGSVLACAICIGVAFGLWNGTADAAISVVSHDLGIPPGLAMGLGIFIHTPNLAAAPLGALAIDMSARRPFLAPGAIWASAFTLCTALGIFCNLSHRRYMRSLSISSPLDTDEAEKEEEGGVEHAQ